MMLSVFYLYFPLLCFPSMFPLPISPYSVPTSLFSIPHSFIYSRYPLLSLYYCVIYYDDFHDNAQIFSVSRTEKYVGVLKNLTKTLYKVWFF